MTPAGWWLLGVFTGSGLTFLALLSAMTLRGQR